MRSTMLYILLFISAAIVAGLISSAFSLGLLWVLRLSKPKFRYLCLAVVLGVPAGYVAGVIIVALRQDAHLSSAGILTQFAGQYIVTLLVTSLLIRTKTDHSRKALAACVLPWAAIFGILLCCLTVPAYGHVREFEKRLSCSSCLRSVAIALQLYEQDHDGRLPETLEFISGTYLPRGKQFLACPAAPSREYEYDPKATQEAGSMVVWDSLGNHKEGRNVLFGNGDIRFLREEEYQAAVGRPKESEIGRDP
jgi:hypothetical protein